MNRSLHLVLAWTLSPLAGAFPSSYRVETVAGSSRTGDGGPAVMAQIGAIQGIAVDRFGNLYISDTDNHRIRKVTASGVISTLAGTGVAGFGGDGGPASAARFNLPYGLALDPNGNVYVADLGNHRVRRIGSDGIVTTVAGSGVKGSSGDGGLATAAQLSTPRNLAVDGKGNLYISEFDGHRVRRVSPDGKISTFAGAGLAGYRGDGGAASAAQLNSPAGLALDRNGALYIADSQNNRVRRVLPDGTISTALGNSGGMATPHAVAVDSFGTIYVADASSTLVFAYTVDGKRIQFAGTWVKDFQGDGGSADKADLSDVLDLAVDLSGNLYLADSVRVRRVDAAGKLIHTVAGDGYYHAVGDLGPATEAILRRPAAVALDAAGNLWIADTGSQRVRQVMPSRIIATLAGVGAAVSGINQDQMPAASTGLNSPMGVAVDLTGNIFIADTENHRIRMVGRDRNIATVVGTMEGGIGPDYSPPTQTQLHSPRSICFDRSGTLFVVDTANHRVLRAPAGGLVVTVAGNGSPGGAGDGGLARTAQLNQPGACAADSFGNLFVADTSNHRIRKVSPAGIVTTVAGTGDPGFSGDEGMATAARIQAPRGLAVTDNGDLFIADSGNHRIRQVTPDGSIHTIAGQDAAGFAGDGGSANLALLNAPGGLSLDGAGALYFADTNNDRIRRLVPVAAVADALALEPALYVVNAASQQSGPLAPGEIVTISGTGLGPDAGVPGLFDSGRLPTQLGGAEVRFDGAPAPLFYAQSSQLNLQVPYGVAGQATTHMEVFYQGNSAGFLDLPVAAASPGLYSAVNQDGSANAAKAPASAGSVITLYATGEGLTDGLNLSGKAAQVPSPHPVLPLALKIGGKTATVVDASSASGMAGLLQVKATMPAGVPSGPADAELSVGGTAAPVIAIWAK